MKSRLSRLLVCCALLGCKPSGNENGAPSASPPKPSAAAAPPSASIAAPPSPPRSASLPEGERPQTRPTGCRILTLTGSVQRLDGAAPLRPGELFDGGDWLSFGANASATFRHVESTREWTLVGPGRMRPCRGGEEQIAVASGRLRTASGAGARPGAEVLVFTPHGVLRYGDASLELTVGPRDLHALAKAGQVWLEPLEAKTAVLQLSLGKPQTAKAKRPPASLEQRCEALAQHASELGRALTSTVPSAGAGLSARAVEHLRARREARFVCGASESFAASLEPPERGRLLDRLLQLERLYREFPRQPTAPNP